jgi:hypothetical protein
MADASEHLVNAKVGLFGDRTPGPTTLLVEALVVTEPEAVWSIVRMGGAAGELPQAQRLRLRSIPPIDSTLLRVTIPFQGSSTFLVVSNSETGSRARMERATLHTEQVNSAKRKKKNRQVRA